jgi:hypothetical protein
MVFEAVAPHSRLGVSNWISHRIRIDTDHRANSATGNQGQRGAGPDYLMLKEGTASPVMDGDAASGVT